MEDQSPQEPEGHDDLCGPMCIGTEDGKRCWRATTGEEAYMPLDDQVLPQWEDETLSMQRRSSTYTLGRWYSWTRCKVKDSGELPGEDGEDHSRMPGSSTERRWDTGSRGSRTWRACRRCKRTARRTPSTCGGWWQGGDQGEQGTQEASWIEARGLCGETA